MKGLLPDPVRLRVTRGLPQPEFQRDFDLVRGQIRREITATATAPALERWFDLEFAAQLAREIESPHSSMATEQAATRFVNWTSFIRWLGV